MKEGKLVYLEGLRGLSAIMVFLCHFTYAFYFALFSCDAAHAHLPGNAETVIGVSPINFIYNGKLAVRIFFLLCGYVICIRYFQTGDKRYLIKSGIKRYFRLAVPILAMGLVVYILMRLGLYHNGEAAVISKSTEWFAGFNQFTPDFFGMLRESLFGSLFSGDNQYNGVLWIIKYEFLGSLLVYGLLYVAGGWKYRYILYILVLGALLPVDKDLGYISVLLGMISCDVMHTKEAFVRKICKSRLLLAPAFGAGALLCTYPAAGVNLDGTIYRLLGTPRVIIFYVAGSAAVFGVLLNSRLLQRIFEWKALTFLGKYSFGIYLVHFPVIATFSAWFLLRMEPLMSYNGLMAVNLVLTALLVLAGAVLFTKYIEPLGVRLADKAVRIIK